jgi:hypothetical protein
VFRIEFIKKIFKGKVCLVWCPEQKKSTSPFLPWTL